jgi:hypothetical protein
MGNEVIRLVKVLDKRLNLKIFLQLLRLEAKINKMRRT